MKYLLACLFIVTTALAAKPAAKPRRLIVWSIDGFAAGYLSHPEFRRLPVWQRLLKRAQVFDNVETTYPAVTYPAHTTMVTGVPPAVHSLRSNHPVDPFNLSKGAWTWYLQDVAAKTIWDIARSQNRRVANLLWPVTMTETARIRYHLPQFDRAKGPEEVKLMRVLSTPGLHREIEKQTGVALTEYSSDIDRFKAAQYIWQTKKPDIMYFYEPGLDSLEHAKGAYTPAAFEHLATLGGQIEAMLKLSAKHRDTSILMVSDHGFMTFKGKCYPNVILKNLGYVDPVKKTWDYWFDTAGGVARLVDNNSKFEFDHKAAKSEIETACPTIVYVDKAHEDFKLLRNQYSANAAAFLVSRERVILNASLASTVFDAEATGHTHGFLPEREDMKTVALLFGPVRRPGIKIRNVADVFRATCQLAALKCPNQKSAATAKKTP
jgi:predicted AlkP superfamily pyrophosphatase or phosphodiesterase